MRFGRVGNQGVLWLAKVQGTEGDCDLAHSRKMHPNTPLQHEETIEPQKGLGGRKLIVHLVLTPVFQLPGSIIPYCSKSHPTWFEHSWRWGIHNFHEQTDPRLPHAKQDPTAQKPTAEQTEVEIQHQGLSSRVSPT